MIDFLIGALLGGLAVFAVHHFKGSTLKTSPTLDLETAVEAVRGLISAALPKAETSFETLQERISKMLSDAMNQAIADLKTAHDADKARAVAAAVESAGADAVNAKDAEDVAAVQALTAEINAG